MNVDSLGYEPESSVVSALAKRMAAAAIMGSIHGYNVPIVNTTCLQLEVLWEMQRLMPGRHFYACYGDTVDGRRWDISSDGKVDCGVLARNLGGEGIRHHASWVQKIGFGHLIVDPKRPLLRSMVGHDGD